MSPGDGQKKIAADKHALRIQMRGLLRQLAPADRIERSARLCQNLQSLPELQSASTIFLYAALSYEASLDPLLATEGAVSRDQRWVFPRVSGEDLDWLACRNLEDLEIGAFGIREPAKGRTDMVALEEADLILVPGLAFDPLTGGRLGKGAGFYDRSLRGLAHLDKTIPLVGVGVSDQLVPGLPVDRYDIDMGFLCTDEAVIRPSASA